MIGNVAKITPIIACLQCVMNTFISQMAEDRQDNYDLQTEI